MLRARGVAHGGTETAKSAKNYRLGGKIGRPAGRTEQLAAVFDVHKGSFGANYVHQQLYGGRRLTLLRRPVWGEKQPNSQTFSWASGQLIDPYAVWREAGSCRLAD